MPRHPEPCAVSVLNPRYEFAVDPGSREDLEPFRQRKNEAIILVTSRYVGGRRRRSERGNMIQLGLNSGRLTLQGIATKEISATNHPPEP